MPDKNQNSKDFPLVSIVIPCYNGMKFLPISLPSIAELDYPNLEVLIIDDCSTDDSVKYIQKNFPQFKLIQNEVNKGFAYNVEKGFWICKGKYFFMVNQDTLHSKDYLQIAIENLEKDPKIAVFGGKIYKYDFDKKEKTQIIDTIGEQIFKNRQVVDIGQGELEIGQFDFQKEVFGISGQNPIYRVEALKEVAIPLKNTENPEVFDQDFFMYKEDVDLAWRLQLFGWKAFYDFRAVAWHGRGTSAVLRKKKFEIFKNRKLLSKNQRFYSIKNRYLLMVKNDFLSLYFQHFFHIFFNDFLYFFYNLIFDTKNISAYFKFLQQLPKALTKRKFIMQNKKVNATEFKKWYK